MTQTLAAQDTYVLVTGGAGFIGSHTVVELLERGYQVVIVDDLSNASAKVEDRIKTIVGPEAAANLTLYVADVNDREALTRIFDAHRIDRVIHFAGYKAVGESVVELLRPIREETERLLADKSYLESVYRAGAEKAAYVANRTLNKVYKKVGFLPR